MIMTTIVAIPTTITPIVRIYITGTTITIVTHYEGEEANRLLMALKGTSSAQPPGTLR